MDSFRLELRNVVETLPSSLTGDNVLVAETLPSRSWIRMAKNRGNCVVILPEVEGPAQPDIEFANLRVQFNVPCSIRTQGQTRSERLVLIECKSNETRLQECFLDVLAVSLPEKAALSGKEYREIIDALSELFASIQSAGRTTVLGLWGELFLLAEASDRTQAGKAWHASPHDPYDFADGDFRVEVKTAIGRRSHHFSLEQVRPSKGIRVVIASLLTAPSIGGPSIEDLLDTICLDLEFELQLRIRAVALKSLGKGWQFDAATRFDLEMSRATLKWFDSSSIPAVADIPTEVSDVRFKSDLTGCAALGKDRLTGLGRIGEAFIDRSQT